jgi:uncharacterized small protein (TIGR04563 family)
MSEKSEKKKSAGSKDKRKQSLYLPNDLMAEVAAEAARQDRSISWLVQKAWKIAKDRIAQYPSVYEDEKSTHSP